MKQIKKIEQAVSRSCHLVVGIRWQRLQSRISGLYFRRVLFPAQSWAAAGCPEQFRPVLPWWHVLVYQWLHRTGWLRR